MIPEEVLSDLKNAKSFAKMVSLLDAHLREVHGIKGFQLTSLLYSNTILHPGEAELKRGWGFRVQVTIPPGRTLPEILNLLRSADIHVTSGPIVAVQQQHGQNGQAHVSFAADGYMLVDEWASMGVRRRFLGHDTEPGLQVLHYKPSTFR